jgi:uncharacterized membrane protein (DUF441 family)
VAVALLATQLVELVALVALVHSVMVAMVAMAGLKLMEHLALMQLVLVRVAVAVELA